MLGVRKFRRPKFYFCS